MFLLGCTWAVASRERQRGPLSCGSTLTPSVSTREQREELTGHEAAPGPGPAAGCKVAPWPEQGQRRPTQEFEEGLLKVTGQSSSDGGTEGLTEWLSIDHLHRI